MNILLGILYFVDVSPLKYELLLKDPQCKCVLSRLYDVMAFVFEHNILYKSIENIFPKSLYQYSIHYDITEPDAFFKFPKQL